MTSDTVHGDPNLRPPENLLRTLAALLATGYLRLLAPIAAASAPAPRIGTSPKPVDSRRAKSVNWVEHEGGRDA